MINVYVQFLRVFKG